MQIDQWPAFRTSEFIAAYQLDESAPEGVVTVAGSASPNAAAGVAKLWAAARHVPAAATMILKSTERVWVAAGATLVEGRAGLNVGLVMPPLRELVAAPIGPAPGITRFADRYQRTVWDIVERLSRVEADRTMVFRLGAETRRLRASRAGFGFLDGSAEVSRFLASVKAAVSKNKPVSYSLDDDDASALSNPLPPVCLFGEVEADALLGLGVDGWPNSVPAGMDMERVSVAAAVIQRLSASGAGRSARLTVMSAAARPIFVAVPEAEVWAVTVSRSGV